MPTPAPTAAGGTRVAIVCRDDEAGEAVTTFVADLGLEPVISQEPRSDASLDVLESLRQADFALLLQGDRPLELGFLLATVGKQRMCVLQPPSEELPGLGGLPRHSMDEGGLWRLLLARQMKQAGMDVDLNKAL
jgi:hypothetical protein